MRRLKALGLVLMCLVMAAMLITGCSATTEEPQGRAVEETPEPTQEPTPTPEPTETPTPEPTASEFLYKELGEKTADAASFLLTNNTDFVIKSLELSDPTTVSESSAEGTSEPSFGPNLIPADTSIQQGETVCIYYAKPKAESAPTEEASSEASASEDDRGIVFDDNFYDIRMKTDADKELVLYDVDLPDMDACYLSYDEEADVAYIDYMSKDSNETVNTLEAQLFMKDFEAGAIDEKPAASAETATSKPKPVQNDEPSDSSGGSSSGGSSSGGSSGNEGSSSEGSSGESEGSSGESSGDNSGGGSGESSGGDSSGDDWGSSEEMGGSGDCLEDNVIWND